MSGMWSWEEGLSADEWEGAKVCQDCYERYFVSDEIHREECRATDSK